MFEAKAEAKALRPRPRPRPKFWPRGHFGLEDLTSLLLMHNIHTGQPGYSVPGRLRVSNGVVIESSARSVLISHC